MPAGKYSDPFSIYSLSLVMGSNLVVEVFWAERCGIGGGQES
jgi:hypothetical protein